MAIAKILTIPGMSKVIEKLVLSCTDGTITLENSAEFLKC